jgi:hypothetical protein
VAWESGRTSVGLDVDLLEAAPIEVQGNTATIRFKNHTVLATFDPEKSWLLDSVDPDSAEGRQLLKHELGHIVIARQVAVEMTEDLRHFSVMVEGATSRDASALAAREWIARLKEKYASYHRLLEERQKEYDLATKNGSNRNSQEEWSKNQKL